MWANGSDRRKSIGVDTQVEWRIRKTLKITDHQGKETRKDLKSARENALFQHPSRLSWGKKTGSGYQFRFIYVEGKKKKKSIIRLV